jgi:endonuclease/exonuclease/phosphatase family metal-dependent hydrolase
VGPARPQPPLPSAPFFAVVTWNLHAGAGTVPVLVRDLRAGRLTEGAPIDAFVLLLQEALGGTSSHDIVETATTLGLSHYFAPVRRIGTGELGNALISTLPLADTRSIELPQGRQPRRAVAATVTVHGERLLVACVHLENRAAWWRGGGLFVESIRERQVMTLVSSLAAEGPAVLGGDFNAWLGVREPALRTARKYFPDAVVDPPLITFADRLPLDHIMFRQLPDSWIVRQFLGSERYGSDHHPVIAIVARRY